MGTTLQQRFGLGAIREGSGGSRNKRSGGGNECGYFGRSVGRKEEADCNAEQEYEEQDETCKQYEAGIGSGEQFQWSDPRFRQGESGEQLPYYGGDDPSGQRTVQASIHMVQSNKSVSVVLGGRKNGAREGKKE